MTASLSGDPPRYAAPSADDVQREVGRAVGRATRRAVGRCVEQQAGPAAGRLVVDDLQDHAPGPLVRTGLERSLDVQQADPQAVARLADAGRAGVHEEPRQRIRRRAAIGDHLGDPVDACEESPELPLGGPVDGVHVLDGQRRPGLTVLPLLLDLVADVAVDGAAARRGAAAITWFRVSSSSSERQSELVVPVIVQATDLARTPRPPGVERGEARVARRLAGRCDLHRTRRLADEPWPTSSRATTSPRGRPARSRSGRRSGTPRRTGSTPPHPARGPPRARRPPSDGGSPAAGGPA